MTHPTSSATTTVVAILGTEALSEDILARLLEREGYSVRHLATHSTALIDGPLDGVDILLLAPGLDAGLRRALVEAMRSSPKTAHIQILSLSAALKQALLDELSASASWPSLFEELVGQIRTALSRATASTRALVVDGGEPARPDVP